MRKPILLALIFLPVFRSLALACDVCQANQPKVLRGLTHGTGPEGNADFIIVFVAIAIVLFALIYAVKCVARPGERDRDHIKRTILNLDHSGN